VLTISVLVVSTYISFHTYYILVCVPSSAPGHGRRAHPRDPTGGECLPAAIQQAAVMLLSADMLLDVGARHLIVASLGVGVDVKTARLAPVCGVAHHADL
jgi:hypothetical protein